MDMHSHTSHRPTDEAAPKGMLTRWYLVPGELRPKDPKVTVPQADGPHRLMIHGASRPKAGESFMFEAVTVNMAAPIMMLMATKGMNSVPGPPGSGRR